MIVIGYDDNHFFFLSFLVTYRSGEDYDENGLILLQIFIFSFEEKLSISILGDDLNFTARATYIWEIMVVIMKILRKTVEILMILYDDFGMGPKYIHFSNPK